MKTVHSATDRSGRVWTIAFLPELKMWVPFVSNDLVLDPFTYLSAAKAAVRALREETESGNEPFEEED